CSNGSSGFREESAVGRFESLSFDKATPFLRLVAELDEISHTFKTPSDRMATFLVSMFPKGCWLGRRRCASAQGGRMGPSLAGPALTTARQDRSRWFCLGPIWR